MFLVSVCSGLCAVYWSQVSSGEWRCSWSRADRRCSNYIWVINNLIFYQSASYIRDLTVVIFFFLWNCPQDLADDWSTLALVMAWRRQAKSHCLNKCWTSFMMSYGVFRPHWVNWPHLSRFHCINICHKNINVHKIIFSNLYFSIIYTTMKQYDMFSIKYLTIIERLYKC